MRLADKQFILQQIYDGCERCLIAPENPFTLDNPDLIAANGSLLFAVYLLTYREQENLDHLLRRLYLSQLSYGYKMSTVLLYFNERPHDEPINYFVLENAFSHVAESVEDTIKYINSAKPNFKKWKDFSEVQTNQYLNYRVCIELSEKAFRDKHGVVLSDQEDISFTSRVNTRSWYYDIWKECKNYWHTQKGLFGTVKSGHNSSFKSSMDNIMTMSFMTLFNFNEGVIYPSGYYNEPNFINTDWAVFNEDRVPNRYNRMLSFIGIAPVTISSNRDIDWLFDNYQAIRHHVIG